MPDEQRGWLEHLRDNPTEAEIEAMITAGWPGANRAVLRTAPAMMHAARRALFDALLEGK